MLFLTYQQYRLHVLRRSRDSLLAEAPGRLLGPTLNLNELAPQDDNLDIAI